MHLVVNVLEVSGALPKSQESRQNPERQHDCPRSRIWTSRQSSSANRIVFYLTFGLLVNPEASKGLCLILFFLVNPEAPTGLFSQFGSNGPRSVNQIVYGIVFVFMWACDRQRDCFDAGASHSICGGKFLCLHKFFVSLCYLQSDIKWALTSVFREELPDCALECVSADQLQCRCCSKCSLLNKHEHFLLGQKFQTVCLKERRAIGNRCVMLPRLRSLKY